MDAAFGIQEHPQLKLGLRAPDPSLPALKLREFLTGAAPSHPDSADYLQGVTFGLYGNDKFGVCVAPFVRVLTADLRWIPAGEVRVGDRLLGFDEEPGDGNAGRQYKEAIAEKAHIVRRNCYDLTFEDGTKVRCSAEHKWLVRSTVQGELGCQRWQETKELRAEGPRQTKVVKPLDVWETDNSYVGGYLAGAYDGEGNLEVTRHGRYANRICFTQRENQMLAQVESYLTKSRFDFTNYKKSCGKRLRTNGTPREPITTVRINSRSEYLRFLGSVRPVRLLPKLNVNMLGRIDGRTVRLVAMEDVGEQDVVMLDTSARTYFAEGLASHNCGPTSVANSRREITARLKGSMAAPSQVDVFDLYRRSGNPNFDPYTGADDNGVNMQTMLQAVQSGGIGGVKCLGFAKVDVTNLEELQAAVAVFGFLLLGVDLQTAQQKQTDQGVWDYQPSSQWGGHAILNGAYVSSPEDLEVITWAKRVKVTPGFVRKQLSEAWAVVWPEHLSDRGFLEGINLSAFAAAWQDITGKKFPAVVPPAPPPPPPGPPTPVTAGVLTIDPVARKIVYPAGWTAVKAGPSKDDFIIV